MLFLPKEQSDTTAALLGSDEIIYQLLSVINWTPPSIHGSIVRAFHAICCVPAAVEARTT